MRTIVRLFPGPRVVSQSMNRTFVEQRRLLRILRAVCRIGTLRATSPTNTSVANMDFSNEKARIILCLEMCRMFRGTGRRQVNLSILD